MNGVQIPQRTPKQRHALIMERLTRHQTVLYQRHQRQRIHDLFWTKKNLHGIRDAGDTRLLGFLQLRDMRYPQCERAGPLLH